MARISRSCIESFYKTIASEFQSRGLNVLTAPICRLKNEFDRAVKSFEDSGADAIVTLHMDYSPSLESIDALAQVYPDTSFSEMFCPDWETVVIG